MKTDQKKTDINFRDERNEGNASNTTNDLSENISEPKVVNESPADESDEFASVNVLEVTESDDVLAIKVKEKEEVVGLKGKGELSALINKVETSAENSLHENELVEPVDLFINVGLGGTETTVETSPPFVIQLETGIESESKKLDEKKADPPHMPANKLKAQHSDGFNLLSVFENNTLLGLDIGAGGIKYVNLQKSAGKTKILGIGRYPFSRKDGEDIDRAASTVLTESFSPKSLRNTFVKTAVSGMEVVFKNLEMPKLSDKAMRKSIPWACKKDFPFQIDSTVFQYEEIGSQRERADQKRGVMVIAARKDLIKKRLKSLQDANIKPEKISAIPVALLNLFKLYSKGDERGKSYAMVDIGVDSTHIAIIANGELQFAREVSTGGAAFTEALSKEFFRKGRAIQLSQEKAEAVKRQYGIPLQTDEKELAQGITTSELAVQIDPVMAGLVTGIKRTIEFYREKFQVDTISGVFLTGGGALIKNLEERLTSQLEIPTKVMNPFDLLPAKKGAISSDVASCGPQYGVAIGLALDEKESFNFLPTSMRRSQMLQYLKKIYRYVFLAAVLLMIFLSQSTIRQLDGIEQEFKYLQTEFSNGEPSRKKISQLQQEQSALILENRNYGNNVQVDAVAVRCLQIVSNFFPVKTTVISMKLKESFVTGGASNERTLKKVMLIDGIAFSDRSREGMRLAGFMMELDKSGFFSKVDLNSKKINDDGNLQFVIACELK